MLFLGQYGWYRANSSFLARRLSVDNLRSISRSKDPAMILTRRMAAATFFLSRALLPKRMVRSCFFNSRRKLHRNGTFSSLAVFQQRVITFTRSLVSVGLVMFRRLRVSKTCSPMGSQGKFSAISSTPSTPGQLGFYFRHSQRSLFLS
jgi:hypothetical protein